MFVLISSFLLLFARQLELWFAFNLALITCINMSLVSKFLPLIHCVRKLNIVTLFTYAEI
jgi:hypothetical protein